MLVRLENPNSLVVLLSVQVSPAQLGRKTTKKYPTPFFKCFYNIGQFWIQRQHELLCNVTVRNKKGRLGGRGSADKRMRLFVKRQAASCRKQSISIQHKHFFFSRWPMGAGCLPNLCTFKAVRKHQYHIVPLFKCIWKYILDSFLVPRGY